MQIPERTSDNRTTPPLHHHLHTPEFSKPPKLVYSRLHILLAGDVEENPGPQPETNEKCSMCGKTLKKSVTPLVCENIGCTLKCHIQKGCSGIAPTSKDWTWHCLHHGGKTKEVKCVTDTQAQKSTIMRTTLEGSGGTRKCLKCERVIGLTKEPLICRSCKRHCHKGMKCSGLTRNGASALLALAGDWTCEECSHCENREYTTTTQSYSDASEKYIGSDKHSLDKLAILQWNADGLSTKVTELRERLVEEDIDVCVIQETKLGRNVISPKIQGYRAVLRADRKGTMSGGGLIIYAKDSLVYGHVQNSSLSGTESATIKVKLNRAKWIHITNLYVPPVNSACLEVNFNPRKIPTENCLILGDFNAHSQLWDSSSPLDNRGEEVEDWIFTNGLVTLNDGSSTRINKHTGNESSPDVSLASPEWKKKCSWSIGEQLGISDHLPINVTVQVKVSHQSIFSKEPRWKRSGVNWGNFRQEVENQTSSLTPEPNMKKRTQRFVYILKKAGRKHVGKTKPGRKTFNVISSTAKAAIKKRNSLRKKVTTHRKEWQEACAEAREAINSDKEQSWKDLLESAVAGSDGSRLWKVIKSLEGRPESNSPNEAMVHNGRTITTSEKKADIFGQHYAKVSKLCFSKKERRITLKAKRKVRALSTENEYSRIFSKEELQIAILAMKRKGAQGPDDIPPPFLKELGPNALTELLGIFNQSWTTSTCPQSWRNSTILPILKARSPAKELTSFRPISLTSCISKTLEKMIATRLSHLAESRGWFNSQQAGFRKGHGCEDQIIRIIQAVENGFQAYPMKRSVIALLDFSKAFDTVWRERLLLEMIDQGVPRTIIHWLHAFFHNRRAKVSFCGAESRSRLIRQGLPQGSVLSPILFVFYMNSLAERLPKISTNSLYADDVSILGTGNSLKEAEQIVQKSVDVVTRWASRRKLILNAKKSEVSFFSTWTREANWSPTITIGGEKVRFSPTPRLLGVVLDRNLNFGPHVDNISDKLTPKFRMLGAVANTAWGWKKQHLMKVYRAHFDSVLHYAGFAWQPSASDSHIERLSRLQNRALRIVTGQYKSSPKETLRVETGVPNLQTQITRNTVKAVEKSIRLPKDHPRRIAYDSAVLPRNKRGNWRTLADKERVKLPDGMEVRKPLIFYEFPPWLSTPNLRIYPELYGIKRSDSVESKRDAALQSIRVHNAAIVIYTDGSALKGTFCGGSAMVVTKGDPETPTVIATVGRRGSPVTCSNEEEVDAMETAIAWIRVNINDASTTLICTDSQSTCKAIEQLREDTGKIRNDIGKCSCEIIIQWIPGHSLIKGNELADLEAKKETSSSKPGRAVSFRCASSMVNRSFTDSILHKRTRCAYSSLSRKKEREQILSRKDQVLLAQLRTGHHMIFQSYQNKLDQTIDPLCPLCREEPHTVEHWLGRCSATLEMRKEVFGKDVGLGMALLSRWPGESVTLAKRVLFGVSE